MSRYRFEKPMVEPVFGQTRRAGKLRQLLLRGADRVRAEWTLIGTVHNLLARTST